MSPPTLTPSSSPSPKKPKLCCEDELPKSSCDQPTEEEEDDYIDDSDNDEDHDDPRLDEYVDIMLNSDYFYIPDKPPGLKISRNRPARARCIATLTKLTTFALEWYNKENAHANYELVQVLYASRMINGCFIYPITFTARHLDTGVEETFRSMVWDKPSGQLEVVSFDKFDPKLHPPEWLEEAKHPPRWGPNWDDGT